MANPIFNQNTINRADTAVGDERMTISGAIHCSISYALLLVASAVGGFSFAPQLGMAGVIGGAIIGLVAVFVSVFKPTASPVAGPVYAIAQGVAVGIISAIYNAQSNGIILQAVLLTFGTMLAMLALYTMRIIRVTQKFRSIVFAATLGIMFTYVVNLILMAFGTKVPFLHDTGTVGLLISLFIVVVAALNYLLDFDNIERGAAAGLPKYYESTSAIGVLVTTVWLYLEFLRMLSRR